MPLASSSIVFRSTAPSPIGELLLLATETGLSALYMRVMRYPLAEADWQIDESRFREAKAQLAAYFAGELRQFDLRLAPEGTAFHRQVWAELAKIPFGETIAYGELARRVGDPKAARAVGLANGRNPISIIVPCHRVIGADGSLTGYGGGLDNKRWLLDHESRPFQLL